LACAAEAGHIDIVEQFTREEWDHDFLYQECYAATGPRDEWNCLHWAAKGGNVDVIRYLVKERGMAVNMDTRAEDYPIHIAAAYGNLDAVRCLVEELGAPPDMLNGKDQTPMQVPCFGGGESLYGFKELSIADPGTSEMLREFLGLPRIFSGGLEVYRYLKERTEQGESEP
jgi:ankyrin repeat protein